MRPTIGIEVWGSRVRGVGRALSAAVGWSRGWAGAAGGPGALEALEQRVLMSVSVLDEAGVDSFSISSATGSPAAIYADSQEAFVTGASVPGASGAFAPGAADAMIGLNRFRSDARFAGIDGRGFSTVVLDTGIDRDHSFFGPDANRDGTADRIVYQYDFGDNDGDATDVNGHGSNVSSIIGSQDSTWGGVAPGVNIIALKVFSNSGSGTFAMIERALQWVVTNVSKYNISSVNMSLGDNQNWSTSQKLYGVSDELARLAQMNVKVVAAAGNAYFQFGRQGVAYPAADPSVIGVGAVFTGDGASWKSGSGGEATDYRADELAPFSQRSATLSPIFAPGAPMAGAGANGNVISMAGTSQATPVIAGVAALADQLASKIIGRRLTAGEFRSVIVSSGVTIVDGDDESDNVVNTGASFKRVDAFRMGEAILAMGASQGGKSAGKGQASSGSAARNVAPTASSFTVAGRVGEGVAFTYDQLRANAKASDANGDAINFRVSGVANGTLEKNGQRVNGSTTVAPGDSLVWRPSVTRAGTVAAFTFVANDGKADSRAAQMSVSLTGAATQANAPANGAQGGSKNTSGGSKSATKVGKKSEDFAGAALGDAATSSIAPDQPESGIENAASLVAAPAGPAFLGELSSSISMRGEGSFSSGMTMGESLLKVRGMVGVGMRASLVM